MSAVSALFEAIRSEVSYDDLRQTIQSIPTAELVKASMCGLDVLQYAILHRNNEVITILELLGLFRMLKSPPRFPYLHLAAWVNSSMILQTLLQHRPEDADVEIDAAQMSNWVASLKHLGHTITYADLPLADILHAKLGTVKASKDDDSANEPCGVKVVDIAAFRGNIKSVKLLLERYRWGLCEAAVKLSSYQSLQVLIESGSVTKQELAKAFKLSLVRKQSNFVDRILSEEISVMSVLNGLNPYYVMYQCSSSSETSRAENERWRTLPDTTSVLIRHGFDINESTPRGTCPLYSLINGMSVEMCTYNDYAPRYHIETLELLLQHGANPWLDDCLEDSADGAEEGLEHVLESNDLPQYSSAIEALFEMWFTCAHLSNVHVEATFSRCLHKLLERPVLDKDKLSNCLNPVFKQLGATHGKGHYINIVLHIKALLKEGADIQYVPDKDKRNALEMYLISLLETYPDNYFKGHICEAYENTGLLNSILDLSVFLCPGSINTIYSNIADVVVSFEVDTIVETFTDHVMCSLNRARQNVLNLAVMCKLQIWNHIKRDRMKLTNLGIPVNMQKVILELF